MNLNELKVIDLSTVLAGPSVATFLAELGAEVIKIEHPENPDVTRSWKLSCESSESKTSAYFSSINYRKNYLKLNLKDSADHLKFMKLIQDADVLISNFKKGDDQKLNITDAFLRERNPSLIIAKISGFGPESDRIAYDLILQAESGFMSINGEKNGEPLKMPVALIDVLAAHHLKQGILLALRHRDKTKEAKTIQVSLYDAAVLSLTNQASNYLMTGEKPIRMGNLHPNIAPYGEIFTTKDNRHITFAVGSNRQFEHLCSFLELGLHSLERYQSNQMRVQHRASLQVVIQDKVKFRNTEEILESMAKLRVPCAIIRSVDEVLDDASCKELIREEEIEGEPSSRMTSIGFKW